jgi:hypothetical protein
MLHVQCRCGAIGIDVAEEPIAQIFCHCDDCQTVHGAAYVPESVYRAEAVTVSRGNPKQWTLKSNPRFFCPDCGTKLFIDVLALKLRGLNGYLLPKERFNPTYHMQCQFAVQPVRDNLTHYKSLAPQWTGPDETVDW